MKFKNLIKPILIKKKLFLNQALLKLFKRKPIFLLPLIGLGFIFNTNSSLADLKNQYNTQTECNQESADFIYNGLDNWGLNNITRFFCIDKSTNSIWYSTKILRTLFLGYLGKKVNSNQTITQYEIESNTLVKYTCMATDYFSLDCASDVSKKIIGVNKDYSAHGYWLQYGTPPDESKIKSYADSFKTKKELKAEYNRLKKEYNNLSDRIKKRNKTFYMETLKELKEKF